MSYISGFKSMIHMMNVTAYAIHFEHLESSFGEQPFFCSRPTTSCLQLEVCLSQSWLCKDAKHTNKIWIKSRCFSDIQKSSSKNQVSGQLEHLTQEKNTWNMLLSSTFYSKQSYVSFLLTFYQAFSSTLSPNPPGVLQSIFSHLQGHWDTTTKVKSHATFDHLSDRNRFKGRRRREGDLRMAGPGRTLQWPRICQCSGKRIMWVIFLEKQKRGEIWKKVFLGGEISSSCKFLFPHLQVMWPLRPEKTSHVNDLAVWVCNFLFQPWPFR